MAGHDLNLSWPTMSGTSVHLQQPADPLLVLWLGPAVSTSTFAAEFWNKGG